MTYVEVYPMEAALGVVRNRVNMAIPGYEFFHAIIWDHKRVLEVQVVSDADADEIARGPHLGVSRYTMSPISVYSACSERHETLDDMRQLRRAIDECLAKLMVEIRRG
jgi:hypothetical protein